MSTVASHQQLGQDRRDEHEDGAVEEGGRVTPGMREINSNLLGETVHSTGDINTKLLILYGNE